MVWLLEASGARALINQSDVRIGLDIPISMRRSTKTETDQTREEIALIVKGHARMSGEFGPIFVARAFDSDGEPIGYKQMTGVRLLFNEEQEGAFLQLPLEFSFKEAKQAYGKQDQSTANFLKKCINHRLVTRVAHGKYMKLP